MFCPVSPFPSTYNSSTQNPTEPSPTSISASYPQPQHPKPHWPCFCILPTAPAPKTTITPPLPLFLRPTQSPGIRKPHWSYLYYCFYILPTTPSTQNHTSTSILGSYPQPQHPKPQCPTLYLCPCPSRRYPLPCSSLSAQMPGLACNSCLAMCCYQVLPPSGEQRGGG